MLEPIVIASDHAGYELKEALKKELQHLGYEPVDVGTHNAEESVDYPDFATALAVAITEGKASTGIVICGSGIGISIAANRHRHIRAALVNQPEAAHLARQHNNANVLALGARLMDEQTAKDCMKEFLNTEFAGGRHTRRVEKLG